MYVDIYDLNQRFPGWQSDIDLIVGEMRGELVAWAFLNDYDELMSTAIFEVFYKADDQSCRKDMAEWLMNLFVDSQASGPWVDKTRDLYWDGCRWFFEKYLVEESHNHNAQMGEPDDLSAYKYERGVSL
jgi:hypothetical protein